MTNSEQLLQRAPKGWEKPRNRDHAWMPSKASEFDEDVRHRILGPRLSIGSSELHPFEINFDDKGTSEGFAVTLEFDNAYFVEDEDAEEVLDGEWDTADFLDFDEAYEVVISLRNMTEKEAERKAKSIMQRIQSKEDLADFVQEKRKVLYGIDTEDVRNYNVEPYLFDLDMEENGLWRNVKRVLFLSDDKDCVERLTLDRQENLLQEQAETYKENIENDLEKKREKLKSVDQKMINTE